MTAPWLAPCGRPWLSRRPRVDGTGLPNALRRDGTITLPHRTPVARACRLSIDLIGAGPRARAALWWLHRP